VCAIRHGDVAEHMLLKERMLILAGLYSPMGLRLRDSTVPCLVFFFFAPWPSEREPFVDGVPILVASVFVKDLRRTLWSGRFVRLCLDTLLLSPHRHKNECL